MNSIPYGKQHVTQEDIEAVLNVLKSDFLTQGPAVREFELNFAETVHAKNAVAVCNATAGLHLSVRALQTSSKKVLTTPITFVSSSNCILFEGLRPEFVDIDNQSLNLNVDDLETKLKSHPNDYQGIIVVDFAGLPVDLEKIYNLAKKYGLWVIEDACHAIGSYFKDSQNENVYAGSCNYSDTAVFSFHPVKHITTGEGGVITTKSCTLVDSVSRLRSHGIEKNPANFTEKIDSQCGWVHEMQSLGFNYRMPDINAALGNSQLQRLEANLLRRRLIADKYLTELKPLPVDFQTYDNEKFYHAYHLFIMRTKNRRDLYNFLKSKQILCQVHYIPIYWQPYYQKLGFQRGICPKAEAYYNECISLPMYPTLTQLEQGYIIECIHDFFTKY